jgi:hypothetical protein
MEGISAGRAEILETGEVLVNGQRALLEDVVSHAKDLRPVWDALKPMLYDPESYERPDRMEGGQGTSTLRNVSSDPGYLGLSPKSDGKKKKYMRIGRTKRTLKIRSARPYLSRTSEAFELSIAEAIAQYLGTGLVEIERPAGGGGS